MALWTKQGAKWGVKKSIVVMCLLFGSGLLVMLLLGQFLPAGILGFFCKRASDLPEECMRFS
ncbi:MAG: hypothetical protein ACLUPG_11120 [Roseburia faecis]